MVTVASRREALLDLLATRSTRKGSFVLSSGKTSHVYIDARLTTMSPEGLVLIGELGVAELTREFGSVDSVGGLTLGADPIAYAIAFHSAASARPIRAFTVRKEAKGHGTGKLVEGPFRRGDRVVVIEDVITTGASALRAVAALRAADAQVLGVFALVDREEGGREALEAEHLRVVALTTATEILSRGLTPEDQTPAS
jgi:orotate phosphoribosyltransferase